MGESLFHALTIIGMVGISADMTFAVFSAGTALYNCENNSNAQQKRRAEQKLTFLGGVKSVESRSSVRGKPTQTWRHPHMLRSRAARIKPTIPLAHWSGQNALNHTPAHRYILKSLFMHIFADFPDRHRCIWNVSFDYCDGLASQKHNPADSTS